MKKVSLILLLVIFASVALMAAAPLKLVRLTFINKSGHVVYLKLEGQKDSANFYYLTIPKGTKEMPNDETFTVVQDIYTRTAWYGPGDLECEGVKFGGGELWAIKQAKFVFIPCNQMPSNKLSEGVSVAGWDGVLCAFVPFGDPNWAPTTDCTDAAGNVLPGAILWNSRLNQGEPIWGEKIVYFKVIDAYLLGTGAYCMWNVKTRTFKTPTGSCLFLWKY